MFFAQKCLCLSCLFLLLTKTSKQCPPEVSTMQELLVQRTTWNSIFFSSPVTHKKKKKHRQEYLHNIFIDRQLIYSFTAYFLSEKCVSFFCCFRVFREASCLVRARLIARVFLGLRSRGLNFLVL